MNENLHDKDLPPNKGNSEEVDLVVFFNLIGSVFTKIFSFFASIFKGIFSIIIVFLKAIIQYFKLIAIVLLLAFIIGAILEKYKTPVYYSQMLVKPYFDSKYQLVSNIDYYNSLIKSDNYKELSNIFKISEEDCAQILNFKLEVGPETENELFLQYDDFVKSIDSTRAQDTSFEEYVNNRDLFSSNLFLINVNSYKRDIFKSLNKGFESTFSNEYSKKLKDRRDLTISLKKKSYFKDLRKIDSLQIVYLKILEEESKNGSVGIGVEGLLPLTQERTTTREYELFQNELRIRDSISVLDQLIIEEDVYYDVLSQFSEVGSLSTDFTKKYSLLFPVLALIVLTLIFLGIKTVTFVKEYE